MTRERIGIPLTQEQQAELNKQLLHAARESDLEAVKTLIVQGASIHAKNENESTPLHCAALNKNPEAARDIIIELIREGADINAKNKQGRTLLHYAAQYLSVDVIEALVDKGASIKEVGGDGRTLLHCAAHNSTHGTAVIDYLLQRGYGFDINAKNKYGGTPLHEAVTAANVRAIRALIDKGADVNAKDNEDMKAHQTSVCDCCKPKDEQGLVELFLEISKLAEKALVEEARIERAVLERSVLEEVRLSNNSHAFAESVRIEKRDSKSSDAKIVISEKGLKVLEGFDCASTARAFSDYFEKNRNISKITFSESKREYDSSISIIERALTDIFGMESRITLVKRLGKVTGFEFQSFASRSEGTQSEGETLLQDGRSHAAGSLDRRGVLEIFRGILSSEGRKVDPLDAVGNTGSAEAPSPDVARPAGWKPDQSSDKRR